MLPELLLTLQRERDKLWPRAAGGTGETPVVPKTNCRFLAPLGMIKPFVRSTA
jgi:hypothetical protein